MPTATHGGGSVMLWTGPEHLHVTVVRNSALWPHDQKTHNAHQQVAKSKSHDAASGGGTNAQSANVFHETCGGTVCCRLLFPLAVSSSIIKTFAMKTFTLSSVVDFISSPS